MMDKNEEEKLDRLFDFFREIDKEKLITRQTYVTGARRMEDDAEHAWHMAIMAIMLSEYSNEKIDVLKTVSTAKQADDAKQADTTEQQVDAAAFQVVNEGFSTREAIEEAKRCLHCKIPQCKKGCPI